MVGGCSVLSAVSAGSGTVQPNRVQWYHHPGPPTNCWTNQTRTGRGGPRCGELVLTGCPSITLTVSQTGDNHLLQLTTWLERIVKEQKQNIMGSMLKNRLPFLEPQRPGLLLNFIYIESTLDLSSHGPFGLWWPGGAQAFQPALL